MYKQKGEKKLALSFNSNIVMPKHVFYICTLTAVYCDSTLFIQFEKVFVFKIQYDLYAIGN